MITNLVLANEVAQTALGATITAVDILPPFDYQTTATAVAAVAGGILALTFGYMVGFNLVKKVIGRLAGSA